MSLIERILRLRSEMITLTGIEPRHVAMGKAEQKEAENRGVIHDPEGLCVLEGNEWLAGLKVSRVDVPSLLIVGVLRVEE